MDFPLGTEPRDGYYSIELGRAAKKLVTEVRPVHEGDPVLISADTKSDRRTVDATAAAVYAQGGVPVVVTYPTPPGPMQDPPAPVARAAAAAKVWFDFGSAYVLYSAAYVEALRNGCIYVCLPAMDADMMVRTIGETDFSLLRLMAKRLYEMSQAAEQVRVTTPAGTDTVMKIDKKGDHFWEDPPADGGFPQMMPGQSGYAVIRESFEGLLVFDGCIWPPNDLGVLRQPVTLQFEEGRIAEIKGGIEAHVFARWLDRWGHPSARIMDHACYGFNPGIRRLTGRIAEDERLFGCMQFGVGASELGSPVHTDGVICMPSVWLDDVQIEDEGRYVHPELVELCRKMDVDGY
jgi:leucyl aminopeptidase (aminopeptidase T)